VYRVWSGWFIGLGVSVAFTMLHCLRLSWVHRLGYGLVLGVKQGFSMCSKFDILFPLA